MPPEGSPPSDDVVAAAAAAAGEASATPPPAPPEPDPEIEELPEGDTFDRAYVEKLRGEAAKHRTAKQDLLQRFDGYTDEERERFLDLASMLNTDPEAALEEFQGVVTRLAKQLGKETTPVTTDPAPEQEPTTPAEEGTPASVLTPEDVDRLVEERFAAREAEAAREREIAETFAEAEALDPAYKDPAAKAHLFAVAQTNQVGLAEAHALISGQLQEAIDAAVESALAAQGVKRQHPPRLPAGESANDQDAGPPKTIEEASRRARARHEASLRNG